MKMSKKEKTVLTKTQKRSLFRWFLNGGASLNYERMMSMAYTYSMLPWLKENYKGNPEGLKKSVKTHLQYYNCSPYMNPYVMGVNMGIEGQGKENSLDADVYKRQSISRESSYGVRSCRVWRRSIYWC